MIKRKKMRSHKLDAVDISILHNLQQDGRMSNVTLAKYAGVSAPACLRRIRILEQQGYIQGYHADLDANLLGYGVTVFAFVGLESQAEEDLIAFENTVASWPMVRACYMLAGENDFLLKIIAKNLEEFNRFLTENLTATPNVAHVKSSLSLRSTKRNPAPPLISRARIRNLNEHFFHNLFFYGLCLMGFVSWHDFMLPVFIPPFFVANFHKITQTPL